MATTMRNRAGGRIGVGLAAMAAALAVGVFPTSGAGQEKEKPARPAPTILVRDLDLLPRPLPMQALLDMEPVQQELKVTEAQKKEHAAIRERQTPKFRQLLRDNKDRSKFMEARAAILKETAAAIRGILRPEQRERLEQIQLRAYGPLAFARPAEGPMAGIPDDGPPLSKRLALSDAQLIRIRAIVEAGQETITRAAGATIPVDPKDPPTTAEAVRKLVESPEFRAAKEAARREARAARATVMGHIEEVLTEPQRRVYREMLGPPFDLSRLVWIGPEQERMIDLNQVAQALGVAGAGGGQRADPDFKTKVDRPAYAGSSKHPRVLFDEAHHNFHTAGGRYKPFAELIASDGYRVIPNGQKFTRDVLSEGDILVIANALGAEGMGMPGASNPAFTDAECDAVRDWVKEGGSLLLISDHAPMGAAAECLAKRFGVSMSKGAVSDPANSSDSPSFLVFSRQNHLLGDHPITRGRDNSERLNKVQTFTGTSLKGPEGSVAILKLADTAVDHSFDEGGEVSARGRSQGLALAFGRGRVVVMGEAAELSAQVVGLDDRFGMNVPGIDNRQMALNILHWLSGLLEPREGALRKAG